MIATSVIRDNHIKTYMRTKENREHPSPDHMTNRFPGAFGGGGFAIENPQEILKRTIASQQARPQPPAPKRPQLQRGSIGNLEGQLPQEVKTYQVPAHMKGAAVTDLQMTSALPNLSSQSLPQAVHHSFQSNIQASNNAQPPVDLRPITNSTPSYSYEGEGSEIVL